MKISDKERIKKIVNTWASLQKQINEHNITRELLLSDEFSQWAVTTPMYKIGEQVYMLSPEFKKANPDIPWSVVSGLRHRLVHDYEGINWSIIVEVVFDEMDDFVKMIEKKLGFTVEPQNTYLTGTCAKCGERFICF